MKLFEFEDKIKEWIGNHRITWCFILFFTGLGLGVLGNLILGGGSKQTVSMGFIYALVLPIIELTAGGQLE